MVTPNPHPLDATVLTNRVRAAVARRVRRGALPVQDFDDAVQAVLLDLYRRAAQRPPPLFAPLCRRVIDACLSNVLRHRRAARRSPPLGMASLEFLDEPIDFRLETRLDEESLCHDLAEVMRGLPPDLRELAECLKRHSLRRAARILGVSRSKLRRRLSRIRRRFETLGWFTRSATA
jgi:RNA polymerase sigma factor (sigma-70 family)